MGKGALRPFFKGHSLKKEKEHEKKEVDKMLSHFVTLPSNGATPTQGRCAHYASGPPFILCNPSIDRFAATFPSGKAIVSYILKLSLFYIQTHIFLIFIEQLLSPCWEKVAEGR